jgi:anti-sigma factor RsiW
MQCKQIDSVLDDYLDGLTGNDTQAALNEHLAECAACLSTVEAANALRARLEQLPVDVPSEDFFARALDQAQCQPQIAEAKKLRVFGGALAAAVVVSVSALLLLSSPTWSPATDTHQVTIAMETATPVNVVFSTMEALQGARVSLQLPDGLELDGYSGRQMLAWTTDLHEGKNVLKLPLVAYGIPTDEIVATLEHGADTKTFRLKVRVI